MKIKLYFFHLVTGLSTLTNMSAQSSAYLDINNVKALINGSGYLFTDLTKEVAAFEVPKGSGDNTIFAGNLWIGGVDPGGSLHMTSPNYRQSGQDIWSGPLDTATVSIDSTTSARWNLVWKVNKSTVDSLKAGLFSKGIPASIANWPGNGDVSVGEAHLLAPYYDGNHNGIYDPQNSSGGQDYPLISGDQAIFFMYNDESGKLHTESGGPSLGIEVHGMAYAFNCMDDTALLNTVFIHYDVINRSSTSYHNAQIGSWTDTDIGYNNDDFIGCDTVLNAYFGYNGAAEDGTGAAGQYGKHPPAQAIVSLNLQISDYMSYNNDFTAQGNPTNPQAFQNYLTAYWLDGTPLTNGGNGYNGNGPVTHFMYPTDPSATVGWSEPIDKDTPGDRRGLSDIGGTFANIQAGAVISFDLAYVFGRDTSAAGTNLTSVTTMKKEVRAVQSDFNAGFTACGSPFEGISELMRPVEAGVLIYPNPAANTLIVQLDAVLPNEKIEVYNITGSIVMNAAGNQSLQQQLDVSSLAPGLYFLRISNDQQSVTRRFVRQ